MIKKKLIGLISTITVATVVGIAASASAESSVIELNYNKELSTPTVKVVDVNYSVSESGLGSFYGKFIADCSEESMEYETLVSSDTDAQYRNEKLTIDWADMSENGEVASSGMHGRLKITVPEGTPEFSVSFTEIAMCSFDGNDEYYPDDITITVPAYKTAVITDAEAVATYTEGEDYDVQTFTAKIAPADVNKTLTWTVSANGETATKAANIDTDYTGESDVVIGLIVQGPSAASATATITVE